MYYIRVRMRFADATSTRLVEAFLYYTFPCRPLYSRTPAEPMLVSRDIELCARWPT